jgi:hypothetical protein
MKLECAMDSAGSRQDPVMVCNEPSVYIRREAR